MKTRSDVGKSENQGNLYIALVLKEKERYNAINQMLYDLDSVQAELIVSNIKQSGLNDLINEKNKIIAEFIAGDKQSQCDFLQAVLIGSGQYEKGDIENTINLLMSFFSKVQPATTSQEDNQAHCDYIASIITRCVLSNNLSTLEKMNHLLIKNQATIGIKGSKSGNSIHVEKDVSLNSQYLDKNNVIAQPIIDEIYQRDITRFEQSSFAKGGVYKQGKKNPASSNIQQLFINVTPPDVANLMMGINEKTREVFPILMPHYMILAHEEHHGLRMLRGAMRNSFNLLPSILKSAYSYKIEEFANIRAAKKSDAVTGEIYGLPTRISHHGSDQFSLSNTAAEPSYANLQKSMDAMLIMGKKEANRQAVMKTQGYKDSMSQLRMSDNRAQRQDGATEFSPLITMLFYNEGLDDLATIQKLIEEYKNNNRLIPVEQNPVHLLAQLSYLWDPTLKENQLKKQKLVELFKMNNLDFDAVDNCNDEYATPLLYAVKAQDIPLIELIFEYGDVKKFIFKTSKFVSKPSNLLSEAIKTANPELVTRIFSHLKKPENASVLKEILLLPVQTSPLYEAIMRDNIPLAMELLDYADANGFLKEMAGNERLLHLVAGKGILQLLEKLISANAEVMKNEQGIDILLAALCSKSANKNEIVQYVSSQIKDPFNTAGQPGTPLLMRCMNQIEEIDDSHFEWVLNQTKPESFSVVNEQENNMGHYIFFKTLNDKKTELFCKYCEDNKVDLSACLRQRNSNDKSPLELYIKGICNPALIRYISQTCDLTQLSLNDVNFIDIDFSKANLAGSMINGSNLTGANLANANLSGVHFIGANLSKANLANANLLNADLTKATLDGAIFLSPSDLGNIGQLKQRLDHLATVLDGQTVTSTKIMLVNVLLSNIASCISQIGAAEKNQAYEEIYRHPLFAKDHSRELGSDFKNFVNSTFSWFSTKDVAIETAAQKQITEIFNPRAATDRLNPPMKET